MKIKSNLDNNLSLRKTLKPHNMIIVFTVVFHEGSKYYKHIFSDECFYKL